MDEFDNDEDSIDREALAESLADLGFQNSAEIAELARFCLRLIPEGSEEESEHDDLHSNATSLGGIPLAPKGFCWPLRAGKPLAFLGQIQPIEEDYVLSFFFDVEQCPPAMRKEDADSCQVYMFPLDDLVPCDPPSNLDPMDRFPSRKFKLTADIMLPDSKSNIFDLMDVPESDVQVVKKLEEDQNESVAYHHVFGCPSIYNGDMEFQCVMIDHGMNPMDIVDQDTQGTEQLENLFEETFDWMLLAQFDSDPSLNWDWIEGGRLFFWIKIDDFEQGNFERVLCVPQFEIPEEEIA